MLKIDGRTKRGLSWKEMKTSGKPINQGVIVGGKCCSLCHKAPDFEKDVIKCMKCNLQFHTPCLLQPIQEEHLKIISENPSFWWFCLECVSAKPNDAQNTVQPDVSANISTDVLLQSTLQTFKKEMLQLVSETIDHKLKDFPKTGTEPAKSDNTSNSWPKLRPAYASVTGESSGKSPPPPGGPPPRQEKSKNTKPDNHVLVLEPKETCDASSKGFNKATMKDVNAAISGINVNFCKTKNTGAVTIGFSDKASKDTAEKKLNQCSRLSANFSTRSVTKMLPKVSLNGINEVIFGDCTDRDEMKSILLKDILKRNSNVKDLIDASNDETLEVVLIQKSMPSEDEVSFSAVLKMSSKVRKAIHNNGNKLFVSLSRCNVSSNYHILQCYHCQKPGHHSNNCPGKHLDPVCLYCGGNHVSKSCPDKSKKCCINCLNSSNPKCRENAYTHNACALNCPVLKPYRERIKNNTMNWSEKN